MNFFHVNYQNKPKQLSRALWHADLGLTRDLIRTRSDAIHTDNHPSIDDMKSHLKTRLRSKSGDSGIMGREPSDKWGVVNEGGNGVSVAEVDGVGLTGNSKDDDDGVFQDCTNHREAGVTEFADDRDEVDALNTSNRRSELQLSKSLEDVSLTDARSRGLIDEKLRRSSSPEIYSDFCVLSYTEPDGNDAGCDYVVFDELDMVLSDEDVVDDCSMEVKDLTPVDSLFRIGEDVVVEVGRKRSASASPPRASGVLLQVFQQRIENIVVNSVAFPPGLFFVQ